MNNILFKFAFYIYILNTINNRVLLGSSILSGRFSDNGNMGMNNSYFNSELGDNKISNKEEDYSVFDSKFSSSSKYFNPKDNTVGKTNYQPEAPHVAHSSKLNSGSRNNDFNVSHNNNSRKSNHSIDSLNFKQTESRVANEDNSRPSTTTNNPNINFSSMQSTTRPVRNNVNPNTTNISHNSNSHITNNSIRNNNFKSEFYSDVNDLITKYSNLSLNELNIKLQLLTTEIEINNIQLTKYQNYINDYETKLNNIKNYRISVNNTKTVVLKNGTEIQIQNYNDYIDTKKYNKTQYDYINLKNKNNHLLAVKQVIEMYIKNKSQ